MQANVREEEGRFGAKSEPLQSFTRSEVGLYINIRFEIADSKRPAFMDEYDRIEIELQKQVSNLYFL